MSEETNDVARVAAALAAVRKLSEEKRDAHREFVANRRLISELQVRASKVAREYNFQPITTPYDPGGRYLVASYQDFKKTEGRRPGTTVSAGVIPHRDLDDAVETMRHLILSQTFDVVPYQHGSEENPSGFLQIRPPR